MRPVLLSAAALLIAGITSVAPAGDDLFTEIETESVYAAPGSRPPQPAPQARASTPQPLISGLSLSDMFLAAGFNPRTDTEGGVTVSVRRDETTLPVRAMLSADDRQLRFGMQLARLSAGQPVPSETLLRLLQANLDHRPAAFAYDQQERRIELQLVIGSDGLTTARLRGHLDQLAEIALKTRDVWSLAGPSTSTTAAVEPDTAALPASSNESLVGKWVASRGANSALALQLNADDTFRLAVVSGTQKSQSRGQFTRSGATLALVGDDGTRLAGTLQVQGDSFVFDLEGKTGSAARLTFQRAP